MIPPAEQGASEYVALERLASKPADEMLHGILGVLQDFDTETLRAIADYRDAIHPGGWSQTMIREYLDVWR